MSLKNKIIYGIIICLVAWFVFCLPDPLFNDPACTVIEDRHGDLLSATIADDGQWRFPYNKSIPEKFKQLLLVFEDQYFYYHPGVNPGSIFRALGQNIRAGKVVSGGSTITMQVIRMSRKGKPRNVWQKLIECILAVRAEIRYSKKEILALYASNAPFGGNVVGLDAAAWRYYNRPPGNLSWAETAALSVLPNAPSMIYPGKNKKIFEAKRNRLLEKLYKNEIIDKTTFLLALEEPLPGTPEPLPQSSLHLLNRVKNDGYREQRVKTTIQKNLQNKVTGIVEKHHQILKGNEIHNAAAIVAEVKTGNVLAYVGNTRDLQYRHSNKVDIIGSERSSGSILKPLLYAAMLSDGELLPKTLVPDIPTQISGYTPKNFDRTNDGAVPADEALYRSLNIPAVRLLQDYGLEKFYHKLKKLNISTLTRPANHYGLSIILGGSEVKLWEITGIYASMARSLNHFREFSSTYHPDDYHPLNYQIPSAYPVPSKGSHEHSIFDAASIYYTFEALKHVNRPRQETGWEYFQSSKQVAWKTGTSFGFRDAWAIGVTPRYVVGVWAGNADGEGRPGLTGIAAAAPILFDIINTLSISGWFDIPYDEMIQIPVCPKSGYPAGPFCEDTDSVFIPVKGSRMQTCPYHELVHLDRHKQYRVTSSCEDVYKIHHEKWFVLPPVMEWYYKKNHPEYRPLPPFAEGCHPGEQSSAMDIIFPEQFAIVYIPVQLDGTKGKVVIKAAHGNPLSTIYWHLDQTYIGKTVEIHEKELNPEPGKHVITLVDEHGEVFRHYFEVLEE